MTTLPYLQDIVQHVTCGDPDVHIRALVAPNADPHNYHLVPQDRLAIAQSELVIQNGFDLEPYLSKIHNKPLLKISAALQNIPQLNNEDGFKIKDPHIWQSPRLMIFATKAIQKRLASFVSPNKSHSYAICSQLYQKQMQNELLQLRKHVQKYSPESRILVTTHDAFHYFGQDFGVRVFSLLGLSDDELPTTQRIEELIHDIASFHVHTVYLESAGSNDRIMKMVARNAGVVVGPYLYGDNLSQKSEKAGTLLGMWKENVFRIFP